MNISGIHNCYGCGVCAIACTKNIIDIVLNEDGFYEPHITDASQCTNCSLCLHVCSYSYEKLSQSKSYINCYAAWSKDTTIQKKCSSGGISFEIGRHLIQIGYKACVVKYDAEQNKAIHYIATTEEELIPSIGSKYIQSHTVNGFKSINKKEKYLVTGTPCQIDSFRRYIQKFHCEENFILLDFFCHGVPSYFLWEKYIQWAETKVGKITHVSWRNKPTGWHDSWSMEIKGKKEFYSKWSQGDMFYNLFLADCCLGKACYDSCKFKYDQSSADIRIGDLWGKTYQNNEDGVSAIIVFTKKGNEILHSLNCEFIKHTFNIIGEGQMKTAAHKTSAYPIIMKMLRDESTSIADCDIALKKYNKRQRNIKRMRHLFLTLKEITTRIQKR